LFAIEANDELDNYEIKPVINTKTGNCTSVQLISKEDKKIIHKIDIDENNPYNKKYPLIKKGEYNYNLYDLSEVNVNTLKIDRSNYVYKPELSRIVYGSCVFWLFKNENYFILTYRFNYLDGTKEDLIAYSSYLYIYNSKGELIKQIENLSEVMGRPVITENGKYLTYRFGGFLAGSGYTLTKAGYRIIDIEEEKTIIDLNLSNQYTNATTLAEDNMIIIRLNGKNYKYLVYDFEKKRIYSKVYDKNTMVKIKKITKDGFILGKKDMLDKESEVHLYSDSFYEKVLDEE